MTRPRTPRTQPCGKALCIDQDLHSLSKNLPGEVQNPSAARCDCWSFIRKVLSCWVFLWCRMNIEWYRDISRISSISAWTIINCWVLPADGICISTCINGQCAAAWRHFWLLCPPHWPENLADNLMHDLYVLPIYDSAYSNKRHLRKCGEIWEKFGPVVLALFAELDCTICWKLLQHLMSME